MTGPYLVDDAGPTQVAVLTPPGRGGVAVVALCGPRALQAIDACFVARNGLPIHQQPIDAVRLGNWLGPHGEELVAVRRSDPPNSIEVHCHGGVAAVRGVIAALVERGCVEVHSSVLLLDPNRSPLAIAARRELPQALTLRAAAVLWDQAQGALDRALSQAAGRTALPAVQRLLGWGLLGQRLTRPWRVAVAGAPNVGKSSLVNAILGYERSIVFDAPGTTRDVVTARTAIDGWPVEFVDTAGLRSSSDPLEIAGIELAKNRLETVDLVVVVTLAELSAAQAEEQTLELFAGVARSTQILRVASKGDLAGPLGADDLRIDTSARSGVGIESLTAALGRRLVPQAPAPGEGAPFTRDQQAALQKCEALLQAGDSATAMALLAALRAGSDGIEAI